MKYNQNRINQLKSFALEAGNPQENHVDIKHKALLLKPKKSEVEELQKQLENEREERQNQKKELSVINESLTLEIGKALLISDYALAAKQLLELRAQQEIVMIRLAETENEAFFNVRALEQAVNIDAASKALREKEQAFLEKLEELIELSKEMNFLVNTTDSTFHGTSVPQHIINSLPKKDVRKHVDLESYY